MFEFIGSIIDSLILIGFGSVAFLRPQSITSKEGSPEQLGKRLKLVKRCGAVMILAGVGLSVVKLIDR